MKKKITLALTALFVISALGYSNTFSLKMNYVIPRAQSGPSWQDSLWTIEFDNMDFAKSQFQGMSLGLSYEYFLTRVLSLEFSIDAFYHKDNSGLYRDYVGFELDNEWWAVLSKYDKYMDVDTFSTGHSLDISITPVQLSLKIAPFGRRNKLIPYVGAGVGVYFWSVRMSGDMIDFNDEYVYETSQGDELPVYPIYQVDAREGENLGKVSFGYHVLGGFMFSLTNALTLDIGFKYNMAKGKFTEGFEGFAPFDLGGYHISLGLNYWF
jgi:opacity protein-like surface antigen